MSSSIPENANSGCVGPGSSNAGKASSCEGCPNQANCASGETAAALAETQRTTEQLKACLSCVSHTILVLSGKGGVGKSTVASQLALTLADQGLAVGLLDVDLCGPSAPRMALGGAQTATATIHKTATGLWIPVYKKNLAVMSISFLLPDRDKAVIWRGPRKNALIQQFLTEVDWSGDTDGLDYLIIDTPPGTSDEHISTVQYLKQANQVSGAIVVTTPEEASLADVRKELNFCQKTQVPILGIIENMGTLETSFENLQFKSKESGNDCSIRVMELIKAKCPELLEDYTIHTSIFAGDGAEQMALDYHCAFWGRLPLDPSLLKATDEGECYATKSPGTTAASRFHEFCQNLFKACPLPSDDMKDA